MTLRVLRILTAIALTTLLALLPACKKKGPGAGSGSESVPGGPATGNSEYVAFAHMKVKEVLEGPLVTDIRNSLAKSGGKDVWEMAEQEMAKNLGGMKFTDIDSISFFVTEVPEQGMPRLIMILAANKPMNKVGMFGVGAGMQPDSRGFYGVRERVRDDKALVHFPDDKTLVVLHPSLADNYLAGYAKNRTAWPMSAEMNAAEGHTFYAAVDVTKIPQAMLNALQAQQFDPLLAARRASLAIDLKGKEIHAVAKGTYADAAAATKAKETAQQMVEMASAMLAKFANQNGENDLTMFAPILNEAQRALKSVTIDASGTELTVAGNLKLEFDFAGMLLASVQKVREAAMRTKAGNNLMQIGLALHNYHSAMGRAVIHGIGPKGQLLANPTQKPLLSWRVAILPYIEQDNLYRQFKLDEPWDSEHNKKLIEQMPKIYAPVAKPGKPGYTHLQMVIGPNAMQPPSVSLTDITDGTSNPIAVAEAAEPVIWTKPDDIMLPGKEVPKDLKKKFGGQFPGGFNVVMWDGAPRFIRDSVSEKTLQLLINPGDGQLIPNDW